MTRRRREEKEKHQKEEKGRGGGGGTEKEKEEEGEEERDQHDEEQQTEAEEEEEEEEEEQEKDEADKAEAVVGMDWDNVAITTSNYFHRSDFYVLLKKEVDGVKYYAAGLGRGFIVSFMAGAEKDMSSWDVYFVMDACERLSKPKIWGCADVTVVQEQPQDFKDKEVERLAVYRSWLEGPVQLHVFFMSQADFLDNIDDAALTKLYDLTIHR